MGALRRVHHRPLKPAPCRRASPPWALPKLPRPAAHPGALGAARSRSPGMRARWRGADTAGAGGGGRG